MILKSLTENQQLLQDQEAEINLIKEDKLKLEAQVKCLCSKNNLIQKSLSENQQLLQDQEAEINLIKEDQQKMSADIKRLCAENNKLQTETQQLLRDQETEINIVREDQIKQKEENKRLGSENNMLKKSLTESQQLLEEAEVTLSKATADRELLEFEINGEKIQIDVNSSMDMDRLGGEKANIKDSKSINYYGCV